MNHEGILEEQIGTAEEENGILEKEQKASSKKVHRVGTITLGITLVGFGAAYLMRLFFPELPLSLLVHLWPASMILLGIEVLFAGFSRREFVMDKGAVVLLFFLVFFLCLMAGGEYIMEHTEWIGLVRRFGCTP